MDSLSYSQVRQMLTKAAEDIIGAKPLLTEIDSKIGDGDHGIGMENGMKKAKEKLSALAEGDNAFSLFSEMGKAMLMSMGGASGVIFGTLFMGGAKGKSAPAIDIEGFRSLFEESLRSIQERGKAQLGDKTMVDALIPAVEAMKAYSGDSLAEFFSAAEKAALEGVEATKQYQAKLGRAKSLMERSIGYQDAGATSTYLILKSMHEFCEEQQS